VGREVGCERSAGGAGRSDGTVGRGEVGRLALRFPIRGEPVALGRVDASMFDPWSALGAQIGLLGEGAEVSGSLKLTGS
jgi:hypothetical protein